MLSNNIIAPPFTAHLRRAGATQARGEVGEPGGIRALPDSTAALQGRLHVVCGIDRRPVGNALPDDRAS